MDVFVIVSGTFSILAVFPLLYLAWRSVREACDLRVIQHELAGLVRESKEVGEEVHRLQQELRSEQQAAKRGIDETKRTVEQASEVVEQAVEQVAEAVAEAESRRHTPLARRLVVLAAALDGGLGRRARGAYSRAQSRGVV